MAATARERRKLQERLEQVLGADEADTLMDQLGGLDAGHASLRDEVRAGFAEARADRAAIRDEMRVGFAEARADLAALRAELKTEMGELRTELKTEMGGLRTELATEMGGLRTELADTRADFSLDIAKQTRQLGLWMLGSQFSLAAMILAATQL